MKKNANKGFSLVELIIVIAIMAVLIGVLAPQFIKQVEKSRESTDLQNIEEVKTAVETYVADHEATGTITVTANTTHFVVNGADVTEYGVKASEMKLKSSQWGGDIVWTYTDYVWTNTTPQTAKYFVSTGAPRS